MAVTSQCNTAVCERVIAKHNDTHTTSGNCVGDLNVVGANEGASLAAEKRDSNSQSDALNVAGGSKGASLAAEKRDILNAEPDALNVAGGSKAGAMEDSDPGKHDVTGGSRADRNKENKDANRQRLMLSRNAKNNNNLPGHYVGKYFILSYLNIDVFLCFCFYCVIACIYVFVCVCVCVHVKCVVCVCTYVYITLLCIVLNTHAYTNITRICAGILGRHQNLPLETSN